MRELLKDALQTAFRMAPWPTEPGLRRVGEPGRDSPVLLTANYDLTVRRLLRALRGVDAWLVVAPARGINVWCAAGGGHLTSHQVVTALKTSGVADRVDHRELILPQLAATGVEGLDVWRRSRWRVRFGPVRAEDVPGYLRAGGEKSEAMRRVAFPLRDRLEMAAAWAAPLSIPLALGALLLRPAWALPLVALSFALAAAVFLVFDRIPGRRGLALGGVATLAALAAVSSSGGGAAAHVAALVAPGALLALLTLDYAGTTPTGGSGHFEGRDWRIRLDPERCAGIHRCWEVCPAACFEKQPDGRPVDLAHAGRCVRCGACVVQCPKDALFFEDGAGRRIPPETLRRFKLNLLGRRSVETAADPAAPPGSPPALS